MTDSCGAAVIMAAVLQRDLMARGVRHLDLEACEALVAGMLRSLCTIERGTAEELTGAGDEGSLDPREGSRA